MFLREQRVRPLKDRDAGGKVPESPLDSHTPTPPLTATTRLRQVTLSSSGPTDMEGSKMAPRGSMKETVESWP